MKRATLALLLVAGPVVLAACDGGQAGTPTPAVAPTLQAVSTVTSTPPQGGTDRAKATFVPVNRDTFDEREVTVGKGEWELPGTLGLPKGSGPFPAVVLVQGSGPQDRDETMGVNKPFQDIAWGLASNGIAVLRYDKRN